MDNWPFFEERFTPILKTEAPAYQDGLLVSLLFLLLTSAALFIFNQRNKKGGAGIVLLTFSTVQPIFLLSIVATIILDVESSLFWGSTFHFAAIVTLIFSIRMLIYLWIWGAFSRGSGMGTWYQKYLKYWGFFGYIIYIPIALLLLNWGDDWLPLGIVGIAYLAFRVVIFIETLHIFPHLRGYPLHIILYLCACEIAPLLFALEGI